MWRRTMAVATLTWGTLGGVTPVPAAPVAYYVIDSDGKVAYKGGRGPFGFKSDEMEQALIMTVLDRHLRAAAANSSGSAK